MEAIQTGQRMPLKSQHSNEELIGKYVRVISDASHKHYRMFGRIVGFVGRNCGDYVKVYFGETQSCANFCRSSLELLN